MIIIFPAQINFLFGRDEIMAPVGLKGLLIMREFLTVKTIPITNSTIPTNNLITLLHNNKKCKNPEVQWLN